jgi:hypothetical protein
MLQSVTQGLDLDGFLDEGKRQFGRPRPRWGDNIKIDLGEIGKESVDWMNLAQVKDR